MFPPLDCDALESEDLVVSMTRRSGLLVRDTQRPMHDLGPKPSFYRGDVCIENLTNISRTSFPMRFSSLTIEMTLDLC